MQENRRRFGRVHLTEPLAAAAGGRRVFILDVSLSGFRVAHEHAMPVGSGCTLEVEWEGERAVIDCRVIRTHPHRTPAASQPVHHSGLEMLSIAPALIRRLVEWHVHRALDERKANARGIPPVAAQSFQTGAGRNFVRHELIDGGWRALPTTDAAQPRLGFTVSAYHMNR